jgi:hypothetical protein
VSTATGTAARLKYSNRYHRRRLVEAVYGLTLQRRLDVAVDVSSDRVGRVAQVLQLDLRVGAGRQQEAGRRMSQCAGGRR